PPATTHLFPYTTLFRSFGLTRDDCGKIIASYVKQKIWPADPFAQLDPKRVGRLLKLATSEGRAARAGLQKPHEKLKVGICGEHRSEEHTSELQSPDHLV